MGKIIDMLVMLVILPTVVLLSLILAAAIWGLSIYAVLFFFGAA